MIRVVLLLYPRWWRERYGNDAASMVSTPSDVFNLALTGLRTRLEFEMKNVTVLFASGLAGLSLWLLGYTTGQLAGGVGDTFQHWWSSLSALGVLSSSMLWIVIVIFQQSRVRGTTE